MNDIFSQLSNSFPNKDMPRGHIQRFEKKLNQIHTMPHKLIVLQRIAIAASVVSLLVLTSVVALNLDLFKSDKSMFSVVTNEFYETEIYFSNKIEDKLSKLSASETFDKEVLNDFRKIDRTFEEVRKELFKNPHDDRLISAVIETYMIKLQLIDELLARTEENKF